jgi:hypothetical protein
MDYQYQKVVQADRMAGANKIYHSGELEMMQKRYVNGVIPLMRQKREAEGIPWTREEIDKLNQEADLVGASHLVE